MSSLVFIVKVSVKKKTCEKFVFRCLYSQMDGIRIRVGMTLLINGGKEGGGFCSITNKFKLGTGSVSTNLN